MPSYDFQESENTELQNNNFPVIRSKIFTKVDNQPLSQRLLTKYKGMFQSNFTPISNKTIVFIIAYMRTGSTLVGSLFQEYPGTFYVFEPLRAVYDVFESARKNNSKSTVLKYADGVR